MFCTAIALQESYSYTIKIKHFFFISTILTFRTNFLTVEEANTTVYLKVSRSNGLNVSVSVEWETVSDTAFGISTFTLSRASTAFVRVEIAKD